jgi:hypothetical protein
LALIGNAAAAPAVNSFSITLAGAVPEPSTWATMIPGFCDIGFMAYRYRTITAIEA